MSRKTNSRSPCIDDIQVTGDILTGRAGFHIVVRYMEGIDLFSHIDCMFGSMRKHPKGLAIAKLFKQILCFFSTAPVGI